jgi:Na+-transporting NADH:ubiquinone oxidoreductase subunit NqrA
VDGGFAGFRAPLATNEAALRREIEKEQIRRDMLRRIELEEEVRRELAMEGAFGTMQQRPLNSVWSNSTPMMMNPVAAAVAVDDSKPPLTMAPPEIKHSPKTSDKDKVILLVSFITFSILFSCLCNCLC